MSAANGLEGRVVLVTGASRGLGRAVAAAATRAGARVIALARTQAALEELDDELRAEGHELTLLPLDVLDGDAIDRLGASIAQRFARLDGFVHCAAELGPLTPTFQLDPTALSRVMSVNAFSAQRLIRSLDPLFRQSSSARLVFLADGNANARRPYWASYAASKAALDAIASAYEAEIRQTPVEVRWLDPGPMNTRLRRAAYPGEPDHTHPEPDEAAQEVVKLLQA
ncbi:MAG: SDR family NAD(P)-dependent oxidoreductase [Geminicoccaceae bacterium]